MTQWTAYPSDETDERVREYLGQSDEYNTLSSFLIDAAEEKMEEDYDDRFDTLEAQLEEIQSAVCDTSTGTTETPASRTTTGGQSAAVNYDNLARGHDVAINPDEQEDWSDVPQGAKRHRVLEGWLNHHRQKNHIVRKDDIHNWTENRFGVSGRTASKYVDTLLEDDAIDIWRHPKDDSRVLDVEDHILSHWTDTLGKSQSRLDSLIDDGSYPGDKESFLRLDDVTLSMTEPPYYIIDRGMYETQMTNLIEELVDVTAHGYASYPESNKYNYPIGERRWDTLQRAIEAALEEELIDEDEAHEYREQFTEVAKEKRQEAFEESKEAAAAEMSELSEAQPAGYE